MSDDYHQLLLVQGLDTKIDQLRHRQANHPIQAELDDLATVQAGQQAVADEHGEAKHELDRNQKRLDDEVSLIEAKRAEIDAKLYDGSVTATKDLLALQDEAKMLLDRQTSIEDDELEIMEQLEPVEAALAAAVAEKAGTDAQIAAKEAELAEALAGVDAELTEVENQRADEVAHVADELRDAYERLRADLGGIAVAALQGSTCTGCNLTLSAVDFDQIKKKPSDAVVHCPECSRLLVR